MTDRDLLKQIAEGLEDKYQQMMDSPLAVVSLYQTIHQYNVFQFASYKVYLLEWHITFHPRTYFIAFTPEKQAYMVNIPREYVALAKSVHISLSGPAEVLSYIQTYLDYTRVNRFAYPVFRQEDLRIASLKDKQQEAELRDRLSKLVIPTIEEREEGFQVRAYAVNQQTLQRWDMRVSREGDILEEQMTEVEENMPFYPSF